MRPSCMLSHGRSDCDTFGCDECNRINSNGDPKVCVLFLTVHDWSSSAGLGKRVLIEGYDAAKNLPISRTFKSISQPPIVGPDRCVDEMQMGKGVI